jgi:hypothetical protein
VLGDALDVTPLEELHRIRPVATIIAGQLAHGSWEEFE